MKDNYTDYSLKNLPGEEWKDIKGYEGLYQVSNKGRIKALSKTTTIRSNNNLNGSKITRDEKIHHCQLQKDGYIRTQLYKDNKRSTVKVHRLVAEAFLPNPDNLPQVNHKDEDKTNNRVENLEWCTNEYNINYSFAKEIFSINLDTGEYKKYKSLEDASRKGFTKSAVSRALNGKRNKAGNCVWKFFNIDEYLLGVLRFNINKRKAV